MIRLTANPTERGISGAAISPDGKYLAYSDPRGISVRLMQTGESQLLADTREFQVIGWHPDSNRILASQLIAFREGAWWEVSIPGRRQRVEPGLPSPDGAWVLNIIDNRLTPRRSDGSGLRDLVTLPPDVQFNGWPAWFPDGTRIVYATLQFGDAAGDLSTQLSSVSTSDGAQVRLLERSGVTIGSVAVLPPARILFMAHDPSPPGGVSSLFEVPAEAGKPADPRLLTSWPEDSMSWLAATADGKRLSFVRTSFQEDVLVAEVLDSRLSLGPIRRLTLDDRDDRPTDWTPDGRVLFTSVRNGTADIFAQGPDEDDPELLVGTGAHGIRAAGHTGRSVAALSSDRPGDEPIDATATRRRSRRRGARIQGVGPSSMRTARALRARRGTTKGPTSYTSWIRCRAAGLSCSGNRGRPVIRRSRRTGSRWPIWCTLPKPRRRMRLERGGHRSFESWTSRDARKRRCPCRASSPSTRWTGPPTAAGSSPRGSRRGTGTP